MNIIKNEIEQLKIDNYSQVPMRVIESSKFSKQVLQTYGLLLYAVNTKKWFLVQRKHSIGIVLTVKGNFKLSDIPSFVSDMTKEEMELLLTIKDKETLKEAKDKILQHPDDRYLDSIWNKIEAAIPLIELAVSKYKSNPNKLSWMWPKGFKRRSVYKEEGMEAATREFSEESGIDLNKIPHTISSVCLTNERIGMSGYIHSTKCWVGCLSSEVNLLSVDKREVEVARRMWMSQEEVLDVLSDDLKSTFLEAVNISRQMINTFS